VSALPAHVHTRTHHAHTTTHSLIRFYNGAPTRSVLLRESRRVPTNPKRTEGPNTPHQRQAANGTVKIFEPKTHKKCCQRFCAKEFKDATNTALVLARVPLYDTSMTRDEMRAALIDNSVKILLHPLDGKPVCTIMTCIAYSCSKTLLYPNTKRSKGTTGDSNRSRAKIMPSIMAWFENEKDLGCIMPDTGMTLLVYPNK
jgi:hypothetical protein